MGEHFQRDTPHEGPTPFSNISMNGKWRSSNALQTAMNARWRTLLRQITHTGKGEGFSVFLFLELSTPGGPHQPEVFLPRLWEAAGRLLDALQEHFPA